MSEQAVKGANQLVGVTSGPTRKTPTLSVTPVIDDTFIRLFDYASGKFGRLRYTNSTDDPIQLQFTKWGCPPEGKLTPSGDYPSFTVPAHQTLDIDSIPGGYFLSTLSQKERFYPYGGCRQRISGDDLKQATWACEGDSSCLKWQCDK